MLERGVPTGPGCAPDAPRNGLRGRSSRFTNRVPIEEEDAQTAGKISESLLKPSDHPEGLADHDAQADHDGHVAVKPLTWEEKHSVHCGSCGRNLSGKHRKWSAARAASYCADNNACWEAAGG